MVVARPIRPSTVDFGVLAAAGGPEWSSRDQYGQEPSTSACLRPLAALNGRRATNTAKNRRLRRACGPKSAWFGRVATRNDERAHEHVPVGRGATKGSAAEPPQFALQSGHVPKHQAAPTVGRGRDDRRDRGGRPPVRAQ